VPGSARGAAGRLEDVRLQTTADVVIIGAGVIGCSTAYHLAQMGVTDVVVLEMDQVGSGSSSKSASMLSLQFCGDELSARMAQVSYARYMEFEEELGVPIDFRKTGWLSVATEETAGHLLEGARLMQSLGVATEVLEPEEIRHRYPEINTQDVALGVWGPDDGSIDPHMIMWGYVQRACAMGVRLFQGVRATGIAVQRGRVQGVETEQGLVRTGVVVNAGGPWAKEIGRWVGVEIPIVNRVRGIVVTGPVPEIPASRPFVEDVTREWYYRPEGRGVLMGMGTQPTEKLSAHISYDMIEEMIDVAVHRVPALERAGVLSAWAGLRPMTPDEHPIVGPVEAAEGLVLSCGWGGMGIMQAPMAGRLAAEFIADGHASTVDPGDLSIERFARAG
jgi:sarcosine oxidase subunit beta